MTAEQAKDYGIVDEVIVLQARPLRAVTEPAAWRRRPEVGAGGSDGADAGDATAAS